MTKFFTNHTNANEFNFLLEKKKIVQLMYEWSFELLFNTVSIASSRQIWINCEDNQKAIIYYPRSLPKMIHVIRYVTKSGYYKYTLSVQSMHFFRHSYDIEEKNNNILAIKSMTQIHPSRSIHETVRETLIHLIDAMSFFGWIDYRVSIYCRFYSNCCLVMVSVNWYRPNIRCAQETILKHVLWHKISLEAKWI